MAGQLTFGFAHAPALEAQDFLPAACNREAIAWLARWRDWPAPALVLHGPPGCGKSHLARIWAQQTGAQRLADLTSSGAPARLPAAGLLDPAQPLADELALLQLYNRAKEEGGRLLLVARSPASAWPIALADLASRLRAAPAVAIGEPDDALLAAVLVKLCDDRQLTVPADAVHYLVRHMERSFAAARRVVDALDRRSLQERRRITVPLVREVLQAQLLPAGPRGEEH